MTDTGGQDSVYGAPAAGDPGPARSLILSGGGMRVSYQAGAIRALMEAGLTFGHMDGTSGGAINLALLLSGQSPEAMCDRWRTLPSQNFLSLRPLKKYLRSADLTAMGDADGILARVFPHLGVDMRQVRAVSCVAGTFNVFDYVRKVNRVFQHTEMDEQLLVASMSLPGVLPPVERNGDVLLDSAFVQDVNLMEAVRRGAEELWVVWCLGNSAQYRGGALRLYVQMLEMGANAALNRELERIAEINEGIARGDAPYGLKRPVRVHLIIPKRPLPLDPDLMTGRVDHATLIDMGYADARHYLDSVRPEGIPLLPESTMMKDSKPGVNFRETMAGFFSLDETDPQAGAAKAQGGTRLAMHATVDIGDIREFISDPQHRSGLIGHIDFAPFGQGIPASGGVFQLFAPGNEPKLKWMVYEMGFTHQGKRYYLAGKKHVRSHSIFRMWTDTTTLFTQLHEGADASGPVVGAGVLTLGVIDLIKLLSTFHSTNAESIGGRLRAAGAFAGFFVRELWKSYVLKR
jgi:predicted acylesterase/phospholipase RssA